MQLDCKNMHHKCKAVCCAAIALPRKFWEENQDKIVTKPVEVLDLPNIGL